MAKFYGRVQGDRGEATRLGHSGMDVTCASWGGAVTTSMRDDHGVTYVTILLSRWHGAGVDAIIYDGPLEALNVGGWKVVPQTIADLEAEEGG
jgi:hypothetical protein